MLPLTISILLSGEDCQDVRSSIQTFYDPTSPAWVGMYAALCGPQVAIGQPSIKKRFD